MLGRREPSQLATGAEDAIGLRGVWAPFDRGTGFENFAQKL